MIRPNTIGSVGHYPCCRQLNMSAFAFDTWKAPEQPFFSTLVENSEFVPGVNSFTMAAGPNISMPNGKLTAFHMPIAMIPDDSRPGYPFLCSVQGSFCLHLDPSKASVGVDAIVGYSNSSSASRQDIHYGTLLPMHKTISDADNYTIEGFVDTTFTTALPPSHENDTGWHLCVGWLIRTRSGAAVIYGMDSTMSFHALYQNRPCYDPSIS